MHFNLGQQPKRVEQCNRENKTISNDSEHFSIAMQHQWVRSYGRVGLKQSLQMNTLAWIVDHYNRRTQKLVLQNPFSGSLSMSFLRGKAGS